MTLSPWMVGTVSSLICRRLQRMGRGHRAVGRVMVGLVVRYLSQDGIEGSSASIMNLFVFDPKEGLGRFVLDEEFVAEVVNVALDVLHGLVLSETSDRVV